MKKSYKGRLYLALMHYPVLNKSGDVIASAVTNLDLHDIARAAKTYDTRGYYVVTPLKDQKIMVDRIVSHWVTGPGSLYNPKRQKALSLIRVKETYQEVLDDITQRENEPPCTVVTCAREFDSRITYGRLREILAKGTPCLLMFGTAWGLSEDFIQEADHILGPINGINDYNHLSVRSAASIILDRLMGDYQ